MLTAVAGYAQESRQDVSISATGAFAPDVYGNAVKKSTTTTIGLLASYRYMLTPRSALEATVVGKGHLLGINLARRCHCAIDCVTVSLCTKT